MKAGFRIALAAFAILDASCQADHPASGLDGVMAVMGSAPTIHDA